MQLGSALSWVSVLTFWLTAKTFSTLFTSPHTHILSHTNVQFQRKAATPREDGDEEAAIDNPFPHGGSRLERRRSNQVNKLTVSDLHGKSKRDLVTYFKNKYDFNGDGIFQDDEVEQMLLDAIEICESRAGLEVEKNMMLNKVRSPIAFFIYHAIHQFWH